MAADDRWLEEASLEQADICGAGEDGEEGEGVDGVGASLVRDGLQVRGDLAVVEARLVWVGGIVVAPPARGNEGLEHVEALQEGYGAAWTHEGCVTKWRCGECFLVCGCWWKAQALVLFGGGC